MSADLIEMWHRRTHLDLFSGIGGFALAAQWAGFETVAFCEIEDFPRKVLEKNFPGVPIHRDIRDLDGEEYAGIDLITGGYPCQPFSTLGKRAGENDTSHLWPEMRRVIRQARPTWVVAENVAGHISMGLDDVLDDLEDIGYSARAVVIPAVAVGANHRRMRVWIVANSTELGLGDNIQEQGYNAPAHFWGKWEEWEIKPTIFGENDGIPNRVDRIKGLGNAIVPQVAYEILRHLPAVYNA